MNAANLWHMLGAIDADYCQQLTQALMHAVWQGCVIALAYAVASRGLRRASANARYVVGVITLLLMVGCLPVTLCLLRAPRANTSRVPSPLAAQPQNAPENELLVGSIMLNSNSATVPPNTGLIGTIVIHPQSVRQSVAGRVAVCVTWASPYASGLYLCGVILMLLRMSLGLWGGRRLRQACVPLSDGAIFEIVRDHARRMGMRVVPIVAYCQRISVPVVLGILRPMILMPATLASGLTPQQLKVVLLHELAHIRRFDLIINVLQRLAEALLFFHPAVRWLSRRVSLERENACDDLVLRSNYGRTEYADALLRVAELCAGVGHHDLLQRPALAATGTNASQFKRRVLRLLASNDQPHFRLTTFGMTFTAVLLAAVIFAPMKWQNIATAQVDSTQGTNPERKAAKQVGEKQPEPKTDKAGTVPVEKEGKEEHGKKAVYEFSVVIAEHVMLLEGKEIITWPEIEQMIARQPNPSPTKPHFYSTHGAYKTGTYDAAKNDMWRLHRDYKLVGHSEGSLEFRTSVRYDRIRTPDDLMPDESLRTEGVVVNPKGEPVAGAEIVLVTPLDESISYKTHTIWLVQGRIRNPLEEVMVHSDRQGQFVLYPPKGEDFFVVAIHPEGGIGFSGRDQLTRDQKIRLLEWAGLVSQFAEEPAQQGASLNTRVPQSGDIPEIIFTQYSSDLRRQEPTLLFGFTHVPPIFQTAISRNFPESNGVSLGISGAAVGLLPGETRRLDLGPLSNQQRQYLEQMRHRSQERQRTVEPGSGESP